MSHLTASHFATAPAWIGLYFLPTARVYQDMRLNQIDSQGYTRFALQIQYQRGWRADFLHQW